MLILEPNNVTNVTNKLYAFKLVWLTLTLKLSEKYFKYFLYLHILLKFVKFLECPCVQTCNEDDISDLVENHTWLSLCSALRQKASPSVLLPAMYNSLLSQNMILIIQLAPN